MGRGAFLGGRRSRRTLVLTVALALAATGCSAAKKPPPRDATPLGGTLRVVLPRDVSTISSAEPASPPLDPQMEYFYDTWEILRCCLLRTLLSHSGRTTEDGGARLLPDLASRMPDVSADGLTWTFDIKKGIRYGPPLQTVEVTAPDFVNAMRREAKIGKPFYSFYFSVIQGFDDYAAGKSDTISGLEAPDPHTLVIKLSRPAGDLGHLMTLTGTAPIPSVPGSPSAPFGVAQGHDEDGYGWFLVATGPYMLEGSDKLDFSLPAAEQPRLAAIVPGRSLHLVRNPSWRRSSDALRPAYVDRIDFAVADDTPALPAMVTEGKADLVLDPRPPNQAVIDLATKVRAEPSLGAVHVGQRDFVRYLSMNLATPPFDDVAVRRAVNYALDKASIQVALGGPFQGRPAGHIALDSLEQNLLVGYDPYRTPNHGGDLVRAKQEMMRSKYDGDRDGVCDASVCRDIPGASIGARAFPKAAAQIARDLARIGLDVRVESMPFGDLVQRIADPTTKTPLVLTIAWGKDFLNASNFFTALFSRASIGTNNFTLLGATPAQLRSWGYSVTTVPAVDDRINQCLRLTGSAQLQCWASLDQYLMEEVVPWAPFSSESQVMVVSPRIVAFSFDQFANQPSLDRIAVRPGS
jgi:peptide/nickel transport system substrate-binding protein